MSDVPVSGGDAAARRPLLPAGPPAPLPIRLLGAAVDWSVVAIGAVIVLLVFSNVVMHVVHKDNAWTTELCELLMVWVSFLGAAAASRRGLQMSINEFLDKLGAGARKWADAAIQLLVLAVLGLLTYFGIIIVRASWGNVLTVLDWPMAVQYLALPVGSVATAVFVGWDLVEILRGKTHEQRYGA
jgi:TRAP-type C4-dicarboxylate transport system permease small subunit